MSYDDVNCPCGERKPVQTMLCDACRADLKDHPAMIRFQATDESTQSRRHDAIILLALSRSRKRRMANDKSSVSGPASGTK